MKIRLHLTSFAMGLVLATATADAAQDPPQSAAATSPDGRVRVEVAGASDGTAYPTYAVTFRGRPAVLRSRLGLDLAGGGSLGREAAIERVVTRRIDEAYNQRPGKRSRVVNRCEEVVVSLREKAAPARRWQVILRAYDDGAAIRYRFPAQEGWKTLEIADERTAVRLPEDARAVALPLKGYNSTHENRYLRKPAAEIETPGEWRLGLPMLNELPGTGWLAVLEANLTDFAGMYLAKEQGDGGGVTFGCRLAPRPGEPGVAVRAALPHESPWRVFLLGDRLEGLVESDLVLNLNEPCAIADTSWIRPGKTTFPWWNGFYEENVPFRMGLNTETAKYYIDFCAEAGIPYHSLDGLDNIAWYGGTIVPYEGADITRGIEGLDLREVIRYAGSKGVKIRLWMHWEAARKHMDRAFPLYREWGVEGIMLDFMDRDDQEMVDFLRRAVAKAAENRLTITLHGVSAPTGLERTYPNLLTHEAVMNLEYDKWDKDGIPPEHDLTIPFTRMLAGPLDFHQGSLRGVPVEQFRARNAAPLVMGTPCRMLASYVVFQNHLPMVADYPSAYRGHPGLPVLAAIPAAWDDTRCLAARVGELAVIARRHGEEWWVGAMGGREVREVEIPLSFLGPGRFHAEVHRDAMEAKGRLATAREDVTAASIVKGSLAPAGGLLVRLTPARPESK
ncbi:Retaining alpha-galactosidase precursor [Aquisphaera giovannonii]|uniref:Retaining alpha-galactosidase n=1 Tax=Aquisphaera giovannonii TaxID=406548 RepID=A0A5B9VYB7_9BACT|nr:glycoside hydrolase family 97 protein [Aquisphaera giovannonii]QEH32725.1 Retaining alpha-galactosidase precursor [Aquisphaera giovannonii]